MTNEERERLTETEQRCKSNTHAINELKESIREVQNEQKAIYEINANIKLMAQSVASVKEDVSDMKEEFGNANKEVKADIGKVKERMSIIETRPDREIVTRYKFISEKAITIIATGIITYILVQIAPNIFG